MAVVGYVGDCRSNPCHDVGQIAIRRPVKPPLHRRVLDGDVQLGSDRCAQRLQTRWRELPLLASARRVSWGKYAPMGCHRRRAPAGVGSRAWPGKPCGEHPLLPRRAIYWYRQW